MAMGEPAGMRKPDWPSGPEFIKEADTGTTMNPKTKVFILGTIVGILLGIAATILTNMIYMSEFIR